MSTDINQDKPANYIISNTDDVDDVIVRPISQSSISSLQKNDIKPIPNTNGDAKVSQLPQPSIVKPKSATPEELNKNNAAAAANGVKPVSKLEQPVGYNDKARAEPGTVRSPVPQIPVPSKIAQSTVKKPSPDEVTGAKKPSNDATSKPSSGIARPTVSRINIDFVVGAQSTAVH